MPLHREREISGAVDAEGLDHAVLRRRLGHEARRQAQDALRVQRIDLDAAAARDLVQETAVHQLDLVCRLLLEKKNAQRAPSSALRAPSLSPRELIPPALVLLHPAPLGSAHV